jgi:Holliday junction resolvase RusA-like endonuclease
MSARYRSWLAVAVPVMAAGMPRQSLPVRVCVTIRGGRGFTTNRDGDNVLKPLIDALRHAGRIPGDTVLDVPRLEVRYEPPAGAGAVADCVVEVSPILEG